MFDLQSAISFEAFISFDNVSGLRDEQGIDASFQFTDVVFRIVFREHGIETFL
jgi:hypothetical protein